MEIRNHWRKDAILFEDKTRSRTSRIVGNLILLRNVVLFFYAEHGDTYESVPALIEHLAASSRVALNLIRYRK